MWRKAWLFVLVLALLPLVHAELIITPQSNTLSVIWNSPQSFQIAIRNNNTFPAYNVSFQNISYFSFPQGTSFAPNETKILSYSVLTNQLFNNQVSTSTVSYFYDVPFSPTPKTWDVFIEQSGFNPGHLVIAQNDAVVFHNSLSQAVQIKDFNTGFAEVDVPAHGTQSKTFSSLANYSFFNSPLGYTGGIDVLSRSSTTLGHDSTTDRQVQFSLSSILSTSTVQINLLSTSIIVGNNQTYPEALIELRNTDPNLLVRGVHISADRWVSTNFTPNDFDLAGNGVQRVLFNITPFVTRTNDTNTTQLITLTVSTQNAGNTSRTIGVFINYQNLDQLTLNGINYTISVLGINDTITACLQHMNDIGFESCQKLRDTFRTNVTQIKEVEAQYKFGEGEITTIKGQLAVQGQVAERLENKLGLYLDKQASVEAKVDANSADLQNLSGYVQEQEAIRSEEVSRQNVRFWVWVSIAAAILLLAVILWMVDNVEYYNALEEAQQL